MLTERLHASETARREAERRLARASERARVMEEILEEQNALLENVPTVIAAGGAERWRARLGAGGGYGAESTGVRRRLEQTRGDEGVSERDRERAIETSGVKSLARRVAELEKALAAKETAFSKQTSLLESLEVEHAAFDADLVAMRLDAEASRRAAADAGKRAREASERERAALERAGGETARADAAEAELATLVKQSDIMAAQLEVASLRLDVLVADEEDGFCGDENRDENRDESSEAKKTHGKTHGSAGGLAERLRRVELDHARMSRETAELARAAADASASLEEKHLLAEPGGERGRAPRKPRVRTRVAERRARCGRAWRTKLRRRRRRPPRTRFAPSAPRTPPRATPRTRLASRLSLRRRAGSPPPRRPRGGGGGGCGARGGRDDRRQRRARAAGAPDLAAQRERLEDAAARREAALREEAKRNEASLVASAQAEKARPGG